MDEGLADLLALERVEVLALGAPVNRARCARLVDGEHEPAVGPEEVDEDVEAIVEHGIALEHAEHALEEEAHRAPHRLRVGRRLRSRGRRTCGQCIAFHERSVASPSLVRDPVAWVRITTRVRRGDDGSSRGVAPEIHAFSEARFLSPSASMRLESVVRATPSSRAA